MKRLIAVILIATCILCAYGCSQGPKSYNTEALAAALATELEFGETLEQSTADFACSVYGIDASLCKEIAIYSGSGATADEVAVFNCVDESAAEEVSLAASLRLDYLKDGYSSYGPQEVPKIEAATLFVDGTTVVVCICNNSDKVAGIIESNAE